MQTEKDGVTVKTLSLLLRGIAPKKDGDVCCLNCLHFFRTKNKCEYHKKLCKKKKKDFFKDVMPPKDNKILEVVLYQKSDKVECFIHADLEYLYWKFIHNKSKWKYSIRFFNVYNIII